jgi:FMN-dependent NADH-azoreductase
MAKILYIQASPRGERSYSVAAADAFIDAYKKTNPGDEITTINVFDLELPAFDGLALQAKYTILHGLKHSSEELVAWKGVEKVINEFMAADKYVFAVPMWNFSIPYRLKHYLDILIQPTYTFSFTPEEGYKGLITGKPVFVSYSRGGEYPEGTDAEAFDFQTKYFEAALGFMGLTDVKQVITEPTLMGGPDVAKTKRVEAIIKARKLAEAF